MNSNISIIVFSNPLTTPGVSLQFEELQGEELFTAVVHDFDGQAFESTTFVVDPNNPLFYWNLNHKKWASGVYLLKVSNGRTIFNIRLLKN